MKYVLLLLFFAQHLNGQTNDSLKGPANIIDGVYLNEAFNCTYDSTAVLFSNVQLVFTNDDSTEYTFQNGTNTYFKAIVKTTNCRCSDCAFYRQIIIDLSTLEKTPVLNLSAANTTWIYWNSWIFPTKETAFKGTLILEDNCVSLTLSHYFDEAHADFIVSQFAFTNLMIQH